MYIFVSNFTEQVTLLKCGGISLGVSWAHVLGDAFSVSNFMNTLAQFLRGMKPTYPPNFNKSPPQNQKPIKPMTSEPLSLKHVSPVGDKWIMPLPCEMDTFSFQVKPTQLAQLQVNLFENDSTLSPIQPFELLSAIIWQAIARIKNGPELNTVTIMKKSATSPIMDEMYLRNNLFVGSIKADFSVVEAHLEVIATLIHDMAKDERAQIEEIVGRDPERSDFIIYGSNLTFVNLEDAGFYGFELKGLSPRFVNCFVDGIGGEGVVLVLPSPKDNNNDKNNGTLKCEEGRVVTLILPNYYMVKLKEELKECGLSA